MKLSRNNFLISIVYFITAAWFFNLYKHYVDAADLLSYISISNNYLAHGFFQSLNSHWSPLLSWLLIPFHFIFEDDIIAFHFLQIVIGFFTLFALKMLMKIHSISESISTVALIIFIPLLFSFEILNGTPDLLFVTLLLFLIIILHQPVTIKSSIVTGIVASLLGLSKSFGFVFFIGFIIMFYAWKFFKQKDSEISKFYIKNFCISLFAFFLISIFWIIPLSIKYHSFIISSSTAYNFNIMNPAINANVFAGVRHAAELGNLTPPEKNQLNYWITPYTYLFEKWTPFQSHENFAQYLKVISRNILSVMSFYFGKDAGTVTLLLFCFLFFVSRKETVELKSFYLEVTVTVLIVSLYVLILAMHRYLWIADVLIFLLFFKMIDICIKQNRKAIAIAFVICFCITIYYQPFLEMKTFVDAGKNLKQTALDLKIKNARIASISSIPSDADSCYVFASTIAYYNHCSYYGILSDDVMTKEGLKQFKQNSIDYLFVFNEPEFELQKIECQIEIDYGKHATEKTFQSDELKLCVYQLK